MRLIAEKSLAQVAPVKSRMMDARLFEIAENLHRAELTVQERADHIAEWVRLTEEKQRQDGVTAQDAPKLSSRGRANEGRPEGGINAAVRELGIDRTEAQRAGNRPNDLAKSAAQSVKSSRELPCNS